eukprot:1161583-Pelagomonas_calceolata.AAC.5
MREEQAQDHGFKHALEGAAGPGVPIVLQFVGLSVPADMHKQQEQLGNTVTAAYYLVRACMLCIAACKSSLCCACFSLNGLALSLLNKVVMRGWVRETTSSLPMRCWAAANRAVNMLYFIGLPQQHAFASCFVQALPGDTWIN